MIRHLLWVVWGCGLWLFVACDGDETSSKSTGDTGSMGSDTTGSGEDTNDVVDGDSDLAGSGGDVGTTDSGPDGSDDMTGSVTCSEPTGVRPDAIAEMQGVYDPKKNRVVFFGGDTGFPIQCNSNPNPVGDLWAYDPQCNEWTLLSNESNPGKRTRHSAVYDSKRHQMLIFGGRFKEKPSDTTYTLFNDVWALDLSTDTWSQVSTVGDAPKARWSAAAIYDAAGDRLIVSAGNIGTSGTTYTPTADTWSLDLTTSSWTKLETSGPKARLFPASAYDAKRNTMVMFGGTTAFFGPMLNDTWVLHLDTLQWEQVHTGVVAAPKKRFWATTVIPDGADTMLLFGGHDDEVLGNRNDVWTFDLDTQQWSMVTAGDQHNPAAPAPGFCDFPVNFVIMEENTPERRSGHLAVMMDHRVVLIGGKTDCGIVDDVWTLDANDFSFELLLEPTVGVACERFGIEGCASFCL
ncbi:MAG: hypothetical protein HUU55_20385 [Myxococcales bacterium]|nr:hypothetical protein [Myxococcales bacterium]